MGLGQISSPFSFGGKMYFDAKISVVGPGLAVNGPVAVIYEALVNAGYKVDLSEFPGQFQYDSKEGWPNTANKTPITGKIEMRVEAMPWGG